METIFVQFADATQQTIVGYFGAPQAVGDWPNTGVVTTSDPRWVAYVSAQPDDMRAALPKVPE